MPTVHRRWRHNTLVLLPMNTVLINQPLLPGVAKTVGSYPQIDQELLVFFINMMEAIAQRATDFPVSFLVDVRRFS